MPRSTEMIVLGFQGLRKLVPTSDIRVLSCMKRDILFFCRLQSSSFVAECRERSLSC